MHVCYNGDMKNSAERINRNETTKKESNKKIAKTALAGLMAIGLAKGTSELNKVANKGVMATERAKIVERVEVDSISIHGGPNLRSDARIPNGPEDIDGSNIILDFGNSDQNMEIPYEGTVYIYEERGDANGEWYGFPAEEFAKTLCDASYIDWATREKIIKQEKDDDNAVWINGKYVELNKSEE